MQTAAVDFTLSGLWASMGLFAKAIVLTLLGMSITSLIVALERVVAFSRARSASTRFAEALSRALEGGDFAAVAAQDRPGEGYLAAVLRAGFKAFRSAPDDAAVKVESVARALERQAIREVQSLKRGLSLLATVGSTAPFVGLLGTVMGIVNSFQSMAKTGSGGLTSVSAGIAEALVTTAFGLLVAIPAVVAFNFLTTWVDARAVDLSESSNELLDLVARHLAAR
jgi:biopolymer transport protein TolQ